jgi:prefoldin subunit 5
MNTTNDQPAAAIAALRTLADNQAEDIERLRAQIDALNAQIYRLRAALIKIAYMTRHEWSANVAVKALEGQP